MRHRKPFVPRSSHYKNIFIYNGEDISQCIPVKAPNRMGSRWGICLGSTFIPVMGRTEDMFKEIVTENGALKLLRTRGEDGKRVMMLFSPSNHISGKEIWSYGSWSCYKIDEKVFKLLVQEIRRRKDKQKEEKVEEVGEVEKEKRDISTVKE